jgi:hypothetical protein
MSSPVPEYHASPAEEVVRGSQSYRETLRRIHAELQPRVYLEIGVRHGFSLALANAPVAIGVDPAPELKAPLGPHARVVTATSDEFFATAAARYLPERIDLAFIDGMHWFEAVLRDFMNVERRADAHGLVVIDDVFPNHPLQAERNRQSSVWTGDVWKIMPCLRRYRPELRLMSLDTSPTGLLAVAGLRPGNDVLANNYVAIVEEFAPARLPPEILGRAGAVAPGDPRFLGLLAELRAERQSAVAGN